MFTSEIKKPPKSYIMKKLLSTFVFGLLLSGAAFAQTTINASATVVADLTVAEEQGVDFGTISNSFTTAPTIDSQTGGNSGDIIGGTPVPGLVSVVGTGGSTIDVVVSPTIVLGNGTDNLDFNPTYSVTVDDIVSGSTITNANAGTAADFTFTLDAGNGTSTIVIGGALAFQGAATSVSDGTYTGTGSITVSYQ